MFFSSFLFGLDDDDQKGLTFLLAFFSTSPPPTLAIGLNAGLLLELTGAPGGGGGRGGGEEENRRRKILLLDQCVLANASFLRGVIV